MHALIIIPAAHLATAEQLAAQNFPQTNGQPVFSVPLWPVGEPATGSPAAYAAAPEFQSEEALMLAQQLVAAIPGAAIDTYTLGAEPPGLLSSHGYHRGLRTEP